MLTVLLCYQPLQPVQPVRAQRQQSQARRQQVHLRRIISVSLLVAVVGGGSGVPRKSRSPMPAKITVFAAAVTASTSTMDRATPSGKESALVLTRKCLAHHTSALTNLAENSQPSKRHSICARKWRAGVFAPKRRWCGAVPRAQVVR